MSLLALIQWLNETPLSVYLRESELAFPLTEAIHLIGVGISVGAIMWVDLRLMGLTMRRERVSDVVGRLEPWAVFGFVVMFVSGILLFLGKPEDYYNAFPFRLKIAVMLLAGVNLLYFHTSVYPRVGGWDDAPATPRAARIVGFVSATVWAVTIVLGRWTAYYADQLFGRAK